MFVCLPCQDNRERQIHHLKDHEKTAKHIRALADFDDSSSSHLPVNNQADALGALFASATANPSQHHHLIPPTPPDHSAAWPAPPSPTGINWNLLEATENTMLEEPLQEYLQSVSQASLDFINGNLSEDELLEHISLGSDSSQGESFLSPVTHFSIKFYLVKIFLTMKLNLLPQNVHVIMQQIQRLRESGFRGLTGLYVLHLFK